MAFDLRKGQSCQLIAFDMTNTDLSESVLQIAACFDDALESIGRDEQELNDAV
ncbi:hypothetical protein [Aminobacter aminovorans]|uniref:Uncharacterized protein n=1 Tax=Aminobacter aminovorans TaxID=83263 RepID=A0AAC9FE79_AMIAI|nr:hypothetical protein [Aminobacter aminovorans]AMS43382.1 hypothetical protein AA2016_4470 [Aminobacter aminovorans]MBB3706060.1 hypothetical protein [Aminobacter aminovorans]